MFYEMEMDDEAEEMSDYGYTCYRVESDLVAACRRGQINLVIELLKSGVDTNERDLSGRTALHYAVDLTHFEENFYKYKFDTCYPLDYYVKLLDISKSLVKVLIAGGACANMVERGRRMPLHIAAATSNYKAMAILLDFSCMFDWKDESGMTALLDCAKVGCYQGLRMLVDKGANIAEVDERNNTALHLAVIGGNIKIIKYLWKKGVVINAKNNMLETPLLLCRQMDHIKFFLDRGANINDVDIRGQTILFTAIESGNIEYLIDLLNYHISPDVNARNIYGNTILHMAVKCYDSNLIHLLLRHGCEIDSFTNDVTSPTCLVILLYIHYDPEDSEAFRYLSVILALLDYHPDLNINSVNGISPLEMVMESDLFPPLKMAVLEYICKVKAAGLPPGRRYPDCLLRSLQTINPSFNDMCHSEILRMKSTKVAKVSMYRLMTASFTNLVCYLKNPKIETFLSQDMTKTFPIYSSFIESKVSLATYRKELVKYGFSFFTSVATCKISHNYVCIACILSFLENKDLKVLSYICKNTCYFKSE